MKYTQELFNNIIKENNIIIKNYEGKLNSKSRITSNYKKYKKLIF
jgi:hypothetical protein